MSKKKSFFGAATSAVLKPKKKDSDKKLNSSVVGPEYEWNAEKLKRQLKQQNAFLKPRKKAYQAECWKTFCDIYIYEDIKSKNDKSDENIENNNDIINQSNENTENDNENSDDDKNENNNDNDRNSDPDNPGDNEDDSGTNNLNKHLGLSATKVADQQCLYLNKKIDDLNKYCKENTFKDIWMNNGKCAIHFSFKESLKKTSDQGYIVISKSLENYQEMRRESRSLNNIISLRSFCNEDILHWLEIRNLLEFIVEAEERDLNFNLPDPNPLPPNVDPETGLIIA
eukprot:Pgem_evm1s19091